MERCKIEDLELQVSSLSAENQKLQRSADLFQVGKILVLDMNYDHSDVYIYGFRDE